MEKKTIDERKTIGKARKEDGNAGSNEPEIRIDKWWRYNQKQK